MPLPGYGAELAQMRHQGMRPNGPVFVCDHPGVARVLFRIADHYALAGRAGQGIDWSLLLGLAVVVIHVDAPDALLDEIQAAGPAELRAMPYAEWKRLTSTFIDGLKESAVA